MSLEVGEVLLGEAQKLCTSAFLPFALVSTIDGALHAIDRETGDVKWTLRDGVEPLVGGGIGILAAAGSLHEIVGRFAGFGFRIRKLPLAALSVASSSPTGQGRSSPPSVVVAVGERPRTWNAEIVTSGGAIDHSESLTPCGVEGGSTLLLTATGDRGSARVLQEQELRATEVHLVTRDCSSRDASIAGLGA
ncbi:unnamed protein product [Cutaneotrichosporon oleaginosum]